MAALLMMKEKIKSLYASYHSIIVPTVKAIVAFLMLMAINDKIGYMRQLDSFLVVLALTAVCAFAPRAITIFFPIYTSPYSNMSLTHHFFKVNIFRDSITFAIFFV